ncbi:MAG: sugar phosphate nucleotidyltransferase [Thermodesulfobacteriota bacterium]
MRAVILAGGKGTRLAPLTEVIPKPLVPLGGKPILEIVLRQLQRCGFRHITLAVGYMAELIQAYFQDGKKWGVKLDYSLESEPLGTAGPLALIDGLDETFLVMNADVLTNLDYRELIRFHKSHEALATIGAYQRRVSIDLGVIVGNGTHRVQDYLEKPANTYLVSMGVYVFEPQVLQFITAQNYLDFPDLVKIVLAQNLPVNYYSFQGYWLDIGRHEDYEQAAEEYEKMQMQCFR